MYIKHKTTEPRESDVNKKAMDNIVKFQEYLSKVSFLHLLDVVCKKGLLVRKYVPNHEEIDIPIM